MTSLGGKVAIITGASSGIGRAIAERLAEDGALVVVNYVMNEEKAQHVVSGIHDKGGKAVAVQANMSQVSEARRLVRDTFQRFGRLDILVNNAGKFVPKLLIEMSEAEFDQIMALQVKGPYFAMQEAAKVLHDGGRIVNISSELTELGRCNGASRE